MKAVWKFYFLGLPFLALALIPVATRTWSLAFAPLYGAALMRFVDFRDESNRPKHLAAVFALTGAAYGFLFSTIVDLRIGFSPTTDLFIALLALTGTVAVLACQSRAIVRQESIPQKAD
jgi:ABC-type cobalamin transport system permease subunit